MIAKTKYHGIAEWDFSRWFALLSLREFAKNSRIFAAFAPGANRAPQFSSLVDQLLRPRLARDELIYCQRKESHQVYETDTRDIARRRSCVSNDTLDFSSARSTNSVGDISSKGAFEFLRSLLAAALRVFAPSRTRVSRSAGSCPRFFRPSA